MNRKSIKENLPITRRNLSKILEVEVVNTARKMRVSVLCYEGNGFRARAAEKKIYTEIPFSGCFSVAIKWCLMVLLQKNMINHNVYSSNCGGNRHYNKNSIL